VELCGRALDCATSATYLFDSSHRLTGSGGYEIHISPFHGPLAILASSRISKS
jgi:hypothetical protein